MVALPMSNSPERRVRHRPEISGSLIDPEEAEPRDFFFASLVTA
jgi:hypothetical protein